MDPDLLITIAAACRDNLRLRFDYRTYAGDVAMRTVEPYRLVNDRRRWYLVAWDIDRSDWRTFRVDRMRPWTPAGPRFAPRPLPTDEEIADRVARGIREATWRYRARVFVQASAEHVRSRLPIAIPVQPLGAEQCTFEPGSDDPRMLALYLGMLDADFTIVDAPDLLEALATVTARFQRAIDASRNRSPRRGRPPGR